MSVVSAAILSVVLRGIQDAPSVRRFFQRQQQLYYSFHAAEQMQRRSITQEDIETALENCHTTMPGSDRRRENLVKIGPALNGQNLWVIVKRDRPHIVVTAYWGEEAA